MAETLTSLFGIFYLPHARPGDVPIRVAYLYGRMLVEAGYTPVNEKLIDDSNVDTTIGELQAEYTPEEDSAGEILAGPYYMQGENGRDAVCLNGLMLWQKLSVQNTSSS